ncbi:cilia- and flagella-associated protein 65 isoform X3 [Tachysurus ichikawai]
MCHACVCQITKEADFACYQRDLQQWEEGEERKKHEFTITEKDLIQTKIQDKTTQGGNAAQQKNSTKTRKFKALPPIRSNSDTVKAEKKAQEEIGLRRPEPPRPTLLHLGVTARSHSLLEYQAQFSSQFSKHHIYRSVSSKLPQSGSTESNLFTSTMPPLTHGPERDLLIHTLTSVLRSLLDDPAFHQELQNTLNDPVPYFTQLRPASPSLPMTSTETPHANYSVCLTASRPDTVAHSHTQSKGDYKPQSCQELNPKLREQVQKSIRRSPEFGDLMEEILLNTLQNLMTEAFLGELVLTARPRSIALPPCSARRNSGRQSSGHLSQHH